MRLGFLVLSLFEADMTDRELLEMAAKAIDYEINLARQAERDKLVDPEHAGLWIKHVTTCWNPLKDDGDALRLAVKLMQFEPYCSRGYTPCITSDAAATRRAIVRAAAAIGDSMQEFPSSDEIRENWT